jgi:hypothetical protein
VPSYNPFDGEKETNHHYKVSYRLGKSDFHLNVNNPVYLPKTLTSEGRIAFTYDGISEDCSRPGIWVVNGTKDDMISEVQQ